MNRESTPPGHRVGTELDGYRIEELLGEGGMAEVYRATHRSTGRVVALKVVQDEKARDPNIRQRFEREWKIMRDIVHPNVVSLLDWRESGVGPLYFAMELLDGRTLHEVLGEEEKLDPLLAIEVFGQAAEGLAAVHAAKIVHRDVKPQNLFLCEPEPHVMKVLDFGLAHIGASPITAAGTLVGTPSWVAPEQITGDAIDARADIYALGLILYRALTGQHPFLADDRVTTLGHQLFTPPPPFGWFVEGVPEPLERLVLHMLRKLPQDRPGSAADVAAALRAIASGIPAPLESPTPPTTDEYGPLNPLAEALVRNALEKRGFRAKRTGG